MSSKNSDMKTEPKDKLWIVFMSFTFFGLINFLPINVLPTCTSYWMYKFRNTSLEIYDASQRTDLQAIINSALTMAIGIPYPIFSALSGAFGHLFDIKKRLITSVVGAIMSFLILTSFIYVNTDDWQYAFFYITLATTVVSQGFLCLLAICGFTLVSHFPESYQGCYIAAQGIGSVCAAILQIISLAVGMTPQMSAIIYFGMAITILIITLTLTFLSFKSAFFQYHMIEYYKVPEHEEKKDIKRIFNIFKKIIPSFLTLLLYLLITMPTHTAITNLVVSENEGNGSLWNDVYFVPTITYLLGSSINLLGRMLATYIPMGPKTLLVLAILRLAFLPLVMLCNAQPRNHLPVVFKHDYQYIIIITTLLLTAGFTFAKALLNISKLVEKEELKEAYHILMVSASAMLALFSPLSALSVKLL